MNPNHPFDGYDTVAEAEQHREKTAEWLRSTGLLWAINRYVLHELGMALTVMAREPKKGTATEREADQIGRFFLWPTDDPDGWGFTVEDDEDGLAKLRAHFPEVAERLAGPTE